MYQLLDHWCGPASVQLAMRALGHRVSQRKLAKIIGTDYDGSDEHDLIRAVNHLGCNFTEIATNNRNEAKAWLKKFSPVAPVLLCVDDHEHWVCVAGVIMDRLWLFDPVNTIRNRRNQGRYALTIQGIVKRWRASRRSRDGVSYYGLAILTVDPKQAKRCAEAAPQD